MRYRQIKIWVAALAVLSLILMAGPASAVMPKNVILMISDGMGYNTIKATNYWTGATPVYETFTVRYGMSTYSASSAELAAGRPGYDPARAWSNFNYVSTSGTFTDSSSAATAMATGVKIYDGQLNISTTGVALKTITEISRRLGKSSGVVTTVQWSHATPAGMFAHNVSRNNYSEIAKEMLGGASPLSVIMGAGNPFYDDNGVYVTPTSSQYDYVGGRATWKALRTPGNLNGWTLIQSKAEFEALATNTVHPTVTKVVGTFQAYTTTQQARSGFPGNTKNPSGMTFNPGVPSLATMSTGALNVLNKDSDGFFLMIEGGAVDWANHANQLGRMIEEQVDFNNSVQAVVNWVNANSNWNETLLIVTADHECGHLWGPTKGSFNGVVNNGAGVLPGASFNSGDHSNALVPLYAIGAGAELLAGYADQWDSVRGWYVDNTELFQVMNGNPVPLPTAFWLPGSGLKWPWAYCGGNQMSKRPNCPLPIQ